VLKEGIYEDPERRDQLLALARFTTTKEGGLRSLKEYVADLRPNQTTIYYLVGESTDRLKSSPYLEAARARGVEVLLLADPVDAFWTSMSPGFDGKPLKSLSQGDVDFGLVPLLETPPSEPETKPAGVDDAVIVAVVKSTLGERVSDVRVSQRLTDSAACLVAGGSGPDRELERLLSRQSRGVGAKPILEINTRHAMVKAISDAKLGGRDGDVTDLSELLFDIAQILEGEVPTDPAAFAKRMSRLVTRGLAVG
jgi:molecular chaperone HtpG